MKTRLAILIGLWAAVALLMLNLLTAILQPRPVLAQRDEQVGRFQISTWASFSGIVLHHHGYIIIDTVTGKIVENFEMYLPGAGTGTNIP